MSNSTDNENMVASKTVIEMIAIASEYCFFVEKMSDYTKEEALVFLQKILPALYLKGVLFPQIEAGDDSGNERFITEEEYELIRLKMAQWFDESDYFSCVDLLEGNTESSPVSMAECLADIYLDLKDFLLLYQKGSFSAQENAIASLKYYFIAGWGNKIATLLPYVHVLNIEETEDQ